MADLKLNLLTGDLDIENGIQIITTYEEEAAQRIKLALGLNLGEWFAGATFGLPWIENKAQGFSETIRYMLGDKFPDTPRFIASTLDDYISEQEYIESVDSNYTFDDSSREFSYTPTIYLISGGILTLQPFEEKL